MPQAARCECRADRQRQTPQWRGSEQEAQAEGEGQASSLPVPTVPAPAQGTQGRPAWQTWADRTLARSIPMPDLSLAPRTRGQVRLARLTCSRWQMYRHKAALHGRQASALGSEQQEGDPDRLPRT